MALRSAAAFPLAGNTPMSHQTIDTPCKEAAMRPSILAACVERPGATARSDETKASLLLTLLRSRDRLCHPFGWHRPARMRRFWEASLRDARRPDWLLGR